ncbi:MAG: thiamine pyrophosphate-binding protein [Bacillota bacterium]|nr:thiamine pyrophosphate-binding protein [Bacillota bacterium]
MRLTGGELIARALIQTGVPWVAGIPGHGCLALVDAFYKNRDELPLYMVRHEQSAAHMADGYFRVTGRPAAAFTSIGPGALNLAVGLATSFVDSTALLALIGETHTYMFGRGVLQEIERRRAADSLSALAPLTKYSQLITRVDQLPHALNRSFRAIHTGRPGPAVIALPMDVQADGMEIDPEALTFTFPGPAGPPGLEIYEAAKLLLEAKRPLILAGGGVLRAGASGALVKLAERIGAAMITTMAGKSSVPEDHPLYAWHAGSKGTSCGNALAASADVVLAVGCRFADETTSSYRHGISFKIPPARLIHIDVDGTEIGKNYPVEIGLCGDARLILEALVDELGKPDKNMLDTPYAAEIAKTRELWFKELAEFNITASPITVSGALKEIRSALPRSGYLVTSSGHSQAQVLQEFPFYEPGTLVTTGGFSTMGFSLPAAFGVKLAKPEEAVIALVGDGDFLMTAQELATARQYDLGVVIVVLNNNGFLSIRDLQTDVYGEARRYATEFTNRKGDSVSPDLTAMASAFSIPAVNVSEPGEVEPAVRRAIAEGGPWLIEVTVNREYPWSGGKAAGWWDVPVPEYLVEQRKNYLNARREERLYR